MLCVVRGHQLVIELSSIIRVGENIASDGAGAGRVPRGRGMPVPRPNFPFTTVVHDLRTPVPPHLCSPYDHKLLQLLLIHINTVSLSMAHIRSRLRVDILGTFLLVSIFVLGVAEKPSLPLRPLLTQLCHYLGHIEPILDRGQGFQYIPKRR